MQTIELFGLFEQCEQRMSYGRFVNKKRICASFSKYCLKKQATTLRRRRVETEFSQSKKWRILGRVFGKNG